MNQNSIYKLCLGIDEKKELGFPDSSWSIKRKRKEINSDFNSISINKIIGLDCEMVLLHNGNYQIVSLTMCKLNLINDNESTSKNKSVKTLVDVSFKPNPHTVKDYITPITGFSKNSKYTFEYSHELIKQLFTKYIGPSDILCGHHIIGDLKLIDIYPKWIIDTCMLFHHPDGPPHFYSLQTLTKTYLHMEIQKGAHTSLEDTQAALKLVWYFYKNGYLKPQWHSIHKCFNDQLEKSPVKTTMSMVQKLLGDTKVNSSNTISNKIQAIYLRGSRAIGTHKPESDWDIIVILDDSIPVTDNSLIKYGNVDIVLFNQSGWISAMKKYIIFVLECVFGLTWFDTIGFKQLFLDHQTSVPKEMRFPYLISNVGLEFNKKIGSAKRALTNGLIHRAKKSLFIAYRFACYGISLVEHGEIKNTRVYNSFWSKINEVSGEDFRRDFSKWIYKCKVPYKRFKGITPKLKRHGGFRKGEESDLSRDLVKIRSSNTNLNLDFDISDLSLSAFINLLKNKTRGEIETICMSDPLKLVTKFHSNPKYPLVQLRYSPMSPVTKLTNQLRGTIIDYKTGELVALPFYRFFDYGDVKHCAQIDWKSAKVQKKMDGSLAIMYFYKEKWHVATSRTPDGSSIMGKIRGRSNEPGFVFRDKFWKLLDEQFANTEWDTNCCYMFEMMTPEHIIICRYPSDKLTLLGIRNMRTLLEIHMEENNLDLDLDLDLNLDLDFDQKHLCLEQLVEKVSKLDAMCEEGYVVVDKDFKRIKIKSKEYVRMQWLYPLCGTVKKIDDKRLLTTIRQESQNDLLLYCPELKPRLNELEKKLDSLCKTIESTYQSIFADDFNRDHRPILKREFAKVVKQLKVDQMVKSGLFKLYRGINPKAFLLSMPLKKLSHYIS